MGGPDQERLMQEAERERLAKETEEIHAEEAAETRRGAGGQASLVEVLGV